MDGLAPTFLSDLVFFYSCLRFFHSVVSEPQPQWLSFCFTKMLLPQGLCICFTVLLPKILLHSPTKVTTCIVFSLETELISGMAGSRGSNKVTRHLSLDSVLALFGLFLSSSWQDGCQYRQAHFLPPQQLLWKDSNLFLIVLIKIMRLALIRLPQVTSPFLSSSLWPRRWSCGYPLEGMCVGFSHSQSCYQKKGCGYGCWAAK